MERVAMRSPKYRQAVSEVALLIGILLIAANLRAPFTGLPPLLGMIQSDFGLSTSAIGALTTLPLLAFAIVSPFSALLAREYGLERALFGALFVIALGIALRSVEAAWCLYLGTAIIGMGIAVGNVLLPSLVKRDFARHIASLTGAYALAMGIAAALGSAAVTPLADAWGWRSALLSFLILPIAAMLVWMKRIARRSRPAAGTPTPPHGGKVWHSALAWQVTLFLGLNSTIYYVVVGWLPSILMDAGMSPAKAGSLHGILQLATAIPGLLLGPVLRRMRDQRLAAALACVCSASGLLGWWAYPNLALAWSILFGAGTGAGIILGLSFIGLRTSNAQHAAALSGMSQCIGYLLASVGPIAIGALHDAFGGWAISLVLCAGLALVGAIMGVLAGRNRSL
jgi:CP family cyanate transporter-like MFS transporter